MNYIDASAKTKFKSGYEYKGAKMSISILLGNRAARLFDDIWNKFR